VTKHELSSKIKWSVWGVRKVFRGVHDFPWVVTKTAHSMGGVGVNESEKFYPQKLITLRCCLYGGLVGTLWKCLPKPSNHLSLTLCRLTLNFRIFFFLNISGIMKTLWYKALTAVYWVTTVDNEDVYIISWNVNKGRCLQKKSFWMKIAIFTLKS
jgi:hypothetical protein